MKITRYVQYYDAGKTFYGILADQTIRELYGNIFAAAEPTGKTMHSSEVKLLAPCEPSKVIAVRQSQRTRDLIFPVEQVVSYVSRFVTLLPGDIVYTGTPGNTKPMAPGDVIEIEVEGVGTLRNRVTRATV
jgi:2-keto-4-pentenoate hydratase/2-oxohepta-3-ene-1,7-dioic acid hydratase in catechol pathway